MLQTLALTNVDKEDGANEDGINWISKVAEFDKIASLAWR